MGGGMLGGTGAGTGGEIPFFIDKVVGAIGEANASAIGAFGDAMRVTIASAVSQMIQSQPKPGFQNMDPAYTEGLLRSQSESQTRNLKISMDAAVEMPFGARWSRSRREARNQRRVPRGRPTVGL
jgi:hypothetical protein